MTGRLLSLSQRCDGLTARRFLHLAKGQERFYWENGQDGYALAGFGMAAELIAWGEDRFDSIQRQVKQLFAGAHIEDFGQLLAGPRLFGGFAFRDDFVPDNTWTIYAPAYFVLPHYQLTQVGDASWLTLIVQIPPEESPDDLLPELRNALATRCAALLADNVVLDMALPEPVEHNYPMSYATWERMINDAVARINSGEMKKVVLSRVAEIRFDHNVNVDAALDILAEQYPYCYRFLFEPRPHHAFFGATPELLAQVEGRRLRTMALAGTIKRGSTEQEDQAQAQQLMCDPKERHEHELVAEALCKRLTMITRELDVPESPRILELSTLFHLQTPVHATLKTESGVLPVIEQLHPTPALGGAPREAALSFISLAEPVPRGWYAAPIGWIDSKLDGVFAVAIRSAVSQDKRVWLYAGAGIVGDSQPQREWDETALKFGPMLSALGIGDAQIVK